MDAIKKYKKILLGIAVIAILFLLYAFFAGGNEEEPLLTSDTASGIPAENSDDLLSLLFELKSINLSTEIFSDPLFTTLEDFSVRLTPQPIGRRNPFAPIGAGVAAQAETSETVSVPQGGVTSPTP